MSEPATNQTPDELDTLRREVERAANHYYHSSQQTGIDNRTKELVIERCLPWVSGPRILELGYVDGLWTDRLVARDFRVDVIEGATRHVEHARARYGETPGVRIFHMLFQEFAPDETYDTIIAGDMIRYLPDPHGFLSHVRTWLGPGGTLIVTVPNSRSLHRRIGTLLGMEASPTAPNRRDQEVGNRHQFDRYDLRLLLTSSGYEVRQLHGCFLKTLSSAQMESWSDGLLRAFLDVGDELEDYCWFLYAICSKSPDRALPREGHRGQ